MTFKEQIAKDNQNIFLNLDEFGELHIVNGKKMPVLVDTLEQIDREKRYQFRHSLYADGVFLKELLLYVKESDFGNLPKIGSIVKFDNKAYTVSDAIDEDGIFSISLEANKT